jgi:hypothetical protein
MPQAGLAGVAGRPAAVWSSSRRARHTASVTPTISSTTARFGHLQPDQIDQIDHASLLHSALSAGGWHGSARHRLARSGRPRPLLGGLHDLRPFPAEPL